MAHIYKSYNFIFTKGDPRKYCEIFDLFQRSPYLGLYQVAHDYIKDYEDVVVNFLNRLRKHHNRLIVELDSLEWKKIKAGLIKECKKYADMYGNKTIFN